MKAELIHKELLENHLKLIDYITNLSKENYNFSYENKWNAGEHLDHIIKSVTILKKAFAYPKWLLKYKFGKANRPSRTPELLIKKYLDKLKTAKPAPSPFQGKKINFEDRIDATKKLKKAIKKLIYYSKKYSEKQLDIYIVPHPLLGKLTMREMLIFTNYHVKHHLELIKNSVQNKIN